MVLSERIQPSSGAFFGAQHGRQDAKILPYLKPLNPTPESLVTTPNLAPTLQSLGAA